MESTHVSNYEKVKESWRKKFLEMDQSSLIQRFGLEEDDQALYITYFHQKLCIDRITGIIAYVDAPKDAPSFNTAITVYNLFYYAVPHPVASHEMIPFREVKRVYPFEAAYQNTIIGGMQELFTGRVSLLKQACERLGGVPLKQGDAGYLLPVFPFLDLGVLFWDADEEFSAQANMLFDSNITDFMHEENVVGIASDAIFYLTKAADMEPVIIYGE